MEKGKDRRKVNREGGRGVATGGIWVYIPPKSVQVNFVWDKNDVRTATEQFYTPKNLYTLKQISGYAPGRGGAGEGGERRQGKRENWRGRDSGEGEKKGREKEWNLTPRLFLKVGAYND